MLYGVLKAYELPELVMDEAESNDKDKVSHGYPDRGAENTESFSVGCDHYKDAPVEEKQVHECNHEVQRWSAVLIERRYCRTTAPRQKRQGNKPVDQAVDQERYGQWNRVHGWARLPSLCHFYVKRRVDQTLKDWMRRLASCAFLRSRLDWLIAWFECQARAVTA